MLNVRTTNNLIYRYIYIPTGRNYIMLQNVVSYNLLVLYAVFLPEKVINGGKILATLVDIAKRNSFK